MIGSKGIRPKLERPKLDAGRPQANWDILNEVQKDTRVRKPWTLIQDLRDTRNNVIVNNTGILSPDLSSPDIRRKLSDRIVYEQMSRPGITLNDSPTISHLKKHVLPASILDAKQLLIDIAETFFRRGVIDETKKTQVLEQIEKWEPKSKDSNGEADSVWQIPLQLL